MNPSPNNHLAGSPAAHAALNALAYDLDINQVTLMIILNGAFDLLPSAGYNPLVAFQWSFSRSGYRMDANRLFAILGAFQQNFGRMLGVRSANGMCARR